MKGNAAALREVWDRVDGKVRQNIGINADVSAEINERPHAAQLRLARGEGDSSSHPGGNGRGERRGRLMVAERLSEKPIRFPDPNSFDLTDSDITGLLSITTREKAIGLD